MSAYELIKDLEKKLSLYQDHYPDKPSLPSGQTHEIIASLIHKSELYPSRLTRDVVKALMEDRAPWPTCDEQEYYLSQSVKVDVLENARLICFPNDTLYVQRTARISEDMPTQLLSELNAHQFLYEICHRGGELSSPHLRLPKSLVDDTLHILLGDRLTPEGDYFRLNIEDYDIFGVGACLWKLLRESCQDLDEAFSEYAVRMRLAAERPYVFEIDFDHGVDADEFLGCAFSYIKSDLTLLEDWPGYAADMALNINSADSLTQQYNASSSNEAVYVKTLTLQPLQSIISNMLRKPKTTLLERIEWFKENARGGYDNRDRTTDHLAELIIKNEHNTYSIENSFPLTQALIEYSRTAPKLLKTFFSYVSDPSYLCFLLSFRPTSHIGLISLYRTIAKTSRRISSKVNYEQIWQDLVWTQGLEVYCNGFENGFEYSHVPSALESICEMVAWFVEYEVTRNARTQSIADTRLPSIKIAVTELRYLTHDGYKNNVFEDHLALIGELVRDRLGRDKNPSKPAPLGNWLLLFWVIEIAEIPKNTDNQLPIQLTKILIDSYSQELRRRRLGDANSGDDPLAFDEMNWSKLLPHMSKPQRRRWLNALSAWEDRDADAPAKEASKFNSGVRLHLRVLLNIYSDSVDESIRREISEELCSVIERFGFAPDKYSGALDYVNDNSDYSPLHLWPAICDLANDFSDEVYGSLLELLAIQLVPLSALLILLDRIILQERKDKVSTLISSRDLSSEELYWIPEFFDLSLRAANNGHISIAKFFLTSIRNDAHKTHTNHSLDLLAKIDLKEIFENESYSSPEKLELLLRYRADADEREVNKSVHEYKQYLIATLNISLDKSKAIDQFARLVKSSPSLHNATGLLRSALSAPTPAEVVALLDQYSDAWMGAFEAHMLKGRVEFADENLHSVLQACLMTARLSEFSQFWSMATKRQRGSYQFADVRSEYLSKSGRQQEAIDYIQGHLSKLGDSSETARSELARIQSTLLEPVPQQQPQIVQLPMRAIESMYVDLRSSWLEIVALSALDQSQILMGPTNSIDDYLLEIIEQVGTELLIRNANLLRKKPSPESKKVILLDIEDMINDWMVSLLRQKMRFIGWTVHEQSRMGWSASGDGVGETDGWIQDSKGNLISIIEAFRLGQRIDRTVIKDHLDKIFNYNSPGVSPVFIVAYTSSDDFAGLCSDYVSYVEGLRYKGFDDVPPGRLRVKNLKASRAQARYYEEARFINGSKITIYHQLLNLRMAPQ
ncbi:hypothetical protein [Pseudomonas urethralis]|uniref:hypothetical protein n=1 Tax=Pseudomonas urethralis TaxID=2740517 RepID=UPI001596A44B|nr:hypothetical protein [Pseudomonas urethralis]